MDIATMKRIAENKGRIAQLERYLASDRQEGRDPEVEQNMLLWDGWVVELDTTGTTWKGRVEALVPADLADAVAHAMACNGATIDERTTTAEGLVRLYSRGYYYHIGA